jgi:hypothetical protein
LHHDLRDLSKLFSTEMYQKDACELMDLFAPESLFAMTKIWLRWDWAIVSRSA